MVGAKILKLHKALEFDVLVAHKAHMNTILNHDVLTVSYEDLTTSMVLFGRPPGSDIA